MSLATTAYARLIADATLTALLGTYRGSPSIFVADEGTLPEDATKRGRLPLVVLLGNDTDEPDDTKTTLGRDQTLVIGCYDEADGSTLTMDAIGERIRTLLHREPTGLADGAYIAECSGPFVAPTDDSMYGRAIRLRVVSAVAAA